MCHWIKLHNIIYLLAKFYFFCKALLIVILFFGNNLYKIYLDLFSTFFNRNKIYISCYIYTLLSLLV